MIGHHGYTWSQVRQVPARLLRPLDVLIRPQAGTAYQVDGNGMVRGWTLALTTMPLHGQAWTVSNAVLTGRSTARYVTILPDGTSLSDRALQKVRAQEVGHSYVERRLLALGARPLRAGVTPARWLTDALDDVHALRLRHRGCLRYAMLTSRGARRHVRLRLPTHHHRPPYQPGPRRRGRGYELREALKRAVRVWLIYNDLNAAVE